MTAPAEVRYARSSDGVDIAYTVFGEGPFDLVARVSRTSGTCTPSRTEPP